MHNGLRNDHKPILLLGCKVILRGLIIQLTATLVALLVSILFLAVAIPIVIITGEGSKLASALYALAAVLSYFWTLGRMGHAAETGETDTHGRDGQ